MFLAGLWHGAAWTFVVWGLLHGVYLSCTPCAGAPGSRRGARGVNRAITFVGGGRGVRDLPRAEPGRRARRARRDGRAARRSASVHVRRVVLAADRRRPARVREPRAEHVGGDVRAAPRRGARAAGCSLASPCSRSPRRALSSTSSSEPRGRTVPLSTRRADVGHRRDHVERAPARRARGDIPARAVRAAGGRCDPRGGREGGDLRPAVRRHQHLAHRRQRRAARRCATPPA